MFKSPERVLQLLFWIIIFTMPALQAMWLNFDPDLGWHLRTGAWVVEHNTVPTTDPFSRSSHESPRPWLAYSWLFEVGLYHLHEFWGLAGIVLYRVVMALAVMISLLRLQAKRECRFQAQAVPAALAMISLLPVLTERPWMFTILFSIWTLDAVLSLRAGTAGSVVWLLPVVFMVWANVHIQFVYGLLLLGLGCGAPLVDRYLGRDLAEPGAGRLGSPDWRRLLGLTAACAAATLVNPYHVDVYRVVFEYGTQMVPFKTIDELTAPTFRGTSDWAMLILLGLTGFFLGRKQRLSAFDVLLLGVAAFLAFRAKRDIWFMSMTAVALLATSSTVTQAARLSAQAGRLHHGVLFIGGAVACLLGVGWVFLVTESRLRKELEEQFPVRAVAFVEEKGYAGPLYNEVNWGGFLIWQLPRLPVCIDGRTNLYGNDLIDQAHRTSTGAPGWGLDPNLRAAKVAIVDARGSLAALLQMDKRFRLVYADKVAMVFVASAP
jgi:hypothetical protein